MLFPFHWAIQILYLTHFMDFQGKQEPLFYSLLRMRVSSAFFFFFTKYSSFLKWMWLVPSGPWPPAISHIASTAEVTMGPHFSPALREGVNFNHT